MTQDHISPSAQDFINRIKANEKITPSEFISREYTETERVEIFKACEQNTATKQLSLVASQLTTKTYRQLSKLLRVTRTIIWLKIASNDSIAMDDTQAQIFANGLRWNRSLTWLDFPAHSFNDEALVLICEALEFHPHLVWFHFPAVNLKQKGFDALLRCLKQNRSITYVKAQISAHLQVNWKEFFSVNRSLTKWIGAFMIDEYLDQNIRLRNKALRAAENSSNFLELKTLIENGCSPNLESTAPRQPLLHRAIAAESLESVKYLIQQGASLFETNSSGSNALAYAELTKNESVSAFVSYHTSQLKSDQLYDANVREKTLSYFLWLRSVSDSPFYFDVLPLDLFKVIHSFTRLGFLSRD